MNLRDNCPRCDGQLHVWNELSAEEQEVVKRLPGSAVYSFDERKATHRWCTRCWFESKNSETTTS